MKRNDLILCAAVFILAGALYFSGVLRPQQEGKEAVVYVDTKEYARLSLKEDSVFLVETKGHTNTVEIKDGFADMIQADCPDKLCVKQKKISLQNETIVCLPNKVVIQIEGGFENEIDGVIK